MNILRVAMDNRANTMKKDNLKERTKRPCSGVSKKRAPKNAPTWTVKPTSRNEISRPACSTRTRGSGIEFERVGEAVAEVQKQNRDLLHGEQLLTQQTMLLIL